MDSKTIMLIILWILIIVFAVSHVISELIKILITPIVPAKEVVDRVITACQNGVYLKDYPTEQPVKVILRCSGPNEIVLMTEYDFGKGILLPYRKYGKTWALTKEELWGKDKR